ncbi:MAG: GNAT family N-acetyltransferase [Acidobacteria bacterium]|nr:GNAT family N-acetyltransferase [Acidobacteriota bacterium]
MSLEGVVFRPYRTGDEEAINRGFNEVFKTSRSLDEWRWKFPPAEGGRPIMLAFSGNDLVAHYAGIPVMFQIGEREVPAVQIVDVFSTKAGRRGFSRRGVWVRTVETFFAEFGASGRYSLLFGFPGKRALRLGVLQLGYDAMPPQEIASFHREPGGARTSVQRLAYRAELVGGVEPRLDALWRRVRGDYPVAVVRDARRVSRRLSGRPGVTYHRFVILPRFSAAPVGFVAFRTDGGVCRWVDLVWDHSHPGALALVSHLGARLAAAVEAGYEELWLNGDAAGAERLVSLGFERRPEPNGLVMVARSFDPSLDVTALDGRVFITMADADLV